MRVTSSVDEVLGERVTGAYRGRLLAGASDEVLHESLTAADKFRRMDGLSLLGRVASDEDMTVYAIQSTRSPVYLLLVKQW